MNFEFTSTYSSVPSQKEVYSESKRSLSENIDGCPSREIFRSDRGGSRIVLIESRALHSQCVLQSLRAAGLASRIEGYESLSEWINSDGNEDTELVLLSTSSAPSGGSATAGLQYDISQLKSCRPSVKFAVLSDQETPNLVLQAMQGGAQGYLPTSLSVEMLAQVLQLLKAGGTYVPTASLMDMATSPKGVLGQPTDANSIFGSHRQMMVARALRKGAPNKIIAYQLSMCESTVKVHVRNIMKKLKAKNRTEVALLISHMLPEENLE